MFLLDFLWMFNSFLDILNVPCSLHIPGFLPFIVLFLNAQLILEYLQD